jgi:hypothetical protein
MRKKYPHGLAHIVEANLPAQTSISSSTLPLRVDCYSWLHPSARPPIGNFAITRCRCACQSRGGATALGLAASIGAQRVKAGRCDRGGCAMLDDASSFARSCASHLRQLRFRIDEEVLPWCPRERTSVALAQNLDLATVNLRTGQSCSADSLRSVKRVIASSSHCRGQQ